MKATRVCTSLITCFLPLLGSAEEKPSAQENSRIEAATGAEVGRSAIDGVTVSGKEAFVTRNGATEKLVKELVIDGGTRVSPDGSIQTADGRTVILTTEQVLQFDGNIVAAPIKPGAPVPAPSAAGVTLFPDETVSAVGTVSGQAVQGTIAGSSGSGVVRDIGGSGTFDTFATYPVVIAPGAPAAPNSIVATSVTTDPTTGQPIYRATDPATGQQVVSTRDPRTGQTTTTTTIASTGQQITSTIDSRTGQPVTITKDPRTGETTATIIDRTTGQSIPAQFNPKTGQVTASPNAGPRGSNPPGTPPQNPPGTQPQPPALPNQPAATPDNQVPAAPAPQTPGAVPQGEKTSPTPQGGGQSGAGTGGAGAGSSGAGSSGNGSGGAGPSGSAGSGGR